MGSLTTRRALWALFALLLAIGGYLALSACDFGLSPLFGRRFCKSVEPSAELTDERARQRGLLARLQEAELRAGEKPLCAPPRPPPLPCGGDGKPQCALPPKPKPEPSPHHEELIIPPRKEQLEGCW